MICKILFVRVILWRVNKWNMIDLYKRIYEKFVLEERILLLFNFDYKEERELFEYEIKI